jgi:CRISPR-associated protein Cmr4
MEVNSFLMQCITNLHVGSGDANYGIIDKLVQRDTVYNYPTVHASSLKGALREHFGRLWGGDADPRIIDIFGKKSKDDDDAESGNCCFLNADLITLPVRCTHKQFALTFSQKSIDFVNEKSILITGNELLFSPTNENVLFTNDTIDGSIYLEDEMVTQINHFQIFKKSVSSFKALDNQFAFVTNEKHDSFVKDLPVIARNKLGNNKNLWYEEVVPHQSIFLTFILSNSNHYADFEKELLERFVQIGANSSVGYGLCKFYKITL